MTEDEAFNDIIACLEFQRSILSRMLDQVEQHQHASPNPVDAIRWKLLKNDIGAELARVRGNILVLNLNKPSVLAAHVELKALARAAEAESKKIALATAEAKEMAKLLDAVSKFVGGVGKMVGVFS